VGRGLGWTTLGALGSLRSPTWFRPLYNGPVSKLSERRAARLEQLLERERELWADGYDHVAGIDEAGLGPLAGPLVAAAVIFPPGAGIEGVDDSKKLSPRRRVALAAEIKQHALAYSVVPLGPLEIDRLNVYQAGLEAMRLAVERLQVQPQFLLVDGREIPGLTLPQEKLIKGDSRCHAIAAASILAKTMRDGLMVGYDMQYPGYGFAAHKGYPTTAHRDAIRSLGPCPIHRRSFRLLPR
jgi:ribonuclease HII